MNNIRKIMTASFAILAISCAKKEENNVENVQEDTKEQGMLTITPENLVEVENDFKIDYYAAAEKYAGKQVRVEAVCSGVDMTATIFAYEELTGYLNFFEYLKTNTYTKSLPALVAKPRYLTLITDLPAQKWRPTVSFTDGKTWGYDLPLFDGDDQYYLIYDKKHDQIVIDTELAGNIALYLRAHKGTTEGREETIADIERKLKNKLVDEIYEDLIAGNFYYHSEKFDYKQTPTNGHLSPQSNILIPCKYIIEGTVSTKILDNYFRMVNCKLIKTDWLIDKERFFDKQIKF